MRISEAYSILSSPPKRAKYDREHMAIHAASASPSPVKRGSYASASMAGGRPASGLSRRRGTFQGPPPSFFRSGGWGAQGEKRRAAHEESTGSGAASSGTGAGTGSGTMGGMGPGQDPFGHRDDVPHFDKESHQRTGRHIDRRREARRAADRSDRSDRPVADEPGPGATSMFFVIGGVLLLSFLGPLLVGRVWYGSSAGESTAREKKKKG